MSDLKLDYMPSGFCGGGIRLESFLSKAGNKREGYVNFIADWFEEMKTKYISGIQLMFNPVSDMDGSIKIFNNEIKPKIKGGLSIYADSGGLQLARGSLSMKNKDETQVKNEIYTMMGKYADYGMCFDHLPNMPPKSTNQADYQQIIGVDDLIEPTGIKTGKEIKNQIEFFKKNDIKTKIIAIVHGYTLDQKCRFAESLYSQLSQEDMSFIVGLAPAAVGIMTLDNAYDIYYELNKLPVPAEHLKNIHLLGLASMIKLAPIFVAIKHKKDLFPGIEKFSADSTTFICSEYMGKFQDVKKHHKTYTLGRILNRLTYEMLERRYMYFKERLKKYLDLDLTYKEYLDRFTVYRSDGLHLSESFEDDSSFAEYTFRSFLSFADETHKFFESMQNYEKFYTHKVYGPILHILDNINSRDDYFYYRDILHKTIKLNKPKSMYRVKLIDSLDDSEDMNNTLDNLF